MWLSGEKSMKSDGREFCPICETWSLVRCRDKWVCRNCAYVPS